MEFWIGTNNSVFCSGYNVSTLGQNLQKRYKQVPYPMWSTISLSVLHLYLPLNREDTPNRHLRRSFETIETFNRTLLTISNNLLGRFNHIIGFYCFINIYHPNTIPFYHINLCYSMTKILCIRTIIIYFIIYWRLYCTWEMMHNISKVLLLKCLNTSCSPT